NNPEELDDQKLKESKGGTGPKNNPGKEKKFARTFESSKFFAKSQPEKVLVVPNYKSTEYLQGSNIYHVKQEVSDLKDEDFVKAAQKYKAKKEQEKLTPHTTTSSAERKRNNI
ncbi:9821_t:CDS:2, partial [Paraglomus brasilianum]